RRGRNRTRVHGFAGGILSLANKHLVYPPMAVSTPSQNGVPGRCNATRRSRETKICSRYGLGGKDHGGRLNSLTLPPYLVPACPAFVAILLGTGCGDCVNPTQILKQRRERHESFNEWTPPWRSQS